MKSKLPVWCLLIFTAHTGKTHAQSKEVKVLIDTTLAIMKQQSVNAAGVNWNRVRQEAFAQAANDTSAYQLGPVIRELYKTVNDYHGMFYYKDSAFRWNHNEPVVSDSIMNEWKKGTRVETFLLGDNIGYLRIPGMPYSGKPDCDLKAQGLNDSLCYLLKHGVKGLIIDLRLNGGGAMYPMILGIQQLLEKGQVGSFLSKKNEKWYLTDSTFSLDTSVLASIKPECAINGQGIPIVMLISPPTGSSAEFFIMACKGRPNTVLLGSETAGFITGVEGFAVNDAAYILLSTSYGADRNGIVYKKAFQPDIPFAGIDSFNDIPNDAKVKEAEKWLRQNMSK